MGTAAHVPAIAAKCAHVGTSYGSLCDEQRRATAPRVSTAAAPAYAARSASHGPTGDDSARVSASSSAYHDACSDGTHAGASSWSMGIIVAARGYKHGHIAIQLHVASGACSAINATKESSWNKA